MLSLAIAEFFKPANFSFEKVSNPVSDLYNNIAMIGRHKV